MSNFIGDVMIGNALIHAKKYGEKMCILRIRLRIRIGILDLEVKCGYGFYM